MKSQMEVKGRTFLVTGAGGFIGSHLCEELLKNGAKVRALVKYNSRSDRGMLASGEKEDQMEICFGDIRDPFLTESFVEGCDGVFHLAALIGIPYSYVAPADYVEVNVKGTVNMLEACRKHSIRLVHTSTSEVYGTAQSVPIPENHPLQGQSPYSASKIAADKMVESYFKSFAADVVTVRPFNTYGPRQSSRALIPTVITQALCQDHLQLGSLDPVRDLTFVEDTVSGFIKVGLSDKAKGQVVNLGYGEGHAIQDVVDLILKLAGKEGMDIQTDEQRVRPEKSEVMKLISNRKLAKSVSGWEPKTNLEEGLKKTIDWIEKNIDQYRPSTYTI